MTCDSQFASQGHSSIFPYASVMSISADNRFLSYMLEAEASALLTSRNGIMFPVVY